MKLLKLKQLEAEMYSFLVWRTSSTSQIWLAHSLMLLEYRWIGITLLVSPEAEIHDVWFEAAFLDFPLQFPTVCTYIGLHLHHVHWFCRVAGFRKHEWSLWNGVALCLKAEIHICAILKPPSWMFQFRVSSSDSFPLIQWCGGTFIYLTLISHNFNWCT